MKGLVSRLVAGVVAGVAIYVGFSIWADVGRVGEALRAFHWGYAVLACLLAAGNYAVRFGRWQYYLRRARAHETDPHGRQPAPCSWRGSR